MKPIIVFVYQEIRAPKKGEWFKDHTCNDMIEASTEDWSGPRDIYTRHDIQVPEWATAMRPLFMEDRNGTINVTTGKGHRVIRAIPLPQEKRCRWRRESWPSGGFTTTTSKPMTAMELKTFLGVICIDDWEPIE